MDSFKGLFRRATQTVRQSIGNAEGTVDPALNDCVNKIHMMEKSSAHLSMKLMQLSKLLEDVGTVVNELGEEYKRFSTEIGTGASPEICALAIELSAFGGEFNAKAQQTGRELKENAFDLLSNFVKETPQLKDLEENRKKAQLEYDFFKTKTSELIANPPKDAHDRIPRNENIRENWRGQLHQAAETMKVAAGSMYLQGLKALDMAVYTTAISTGNLLNYGLSSVKVHFANARLPVYQTTPVLPPTPLPPPPPRWMPPMPSATYGAPPVPIGPPGGYGSPQPGMPGYGSPQGGSPGYGVQPGQQPPMQAPPAGWGGVPQQQQQQQQHQHQQLPPGQYAPHVQQQQQQQVPPAGWGAPPANASFAGHGPVVPNNSLAGPPSAHVLAAPVWNAPPQFAAPAPVQQHQLLPQPQPAPVVYAPPQQFHAAPTVAPTAAAHVGMTVGEATYVPPPKPDDGLNPPPM